MTKETPSFAKTNETKRLFCQYYIYFCFFLLPLKLKSTYILIKIRIFTEYTYINLFFIQNKTNIDEINLVQNRTKN